ncbi:hypothetical protein [Ottowia sp. SB7-C50]|uniref:hypothetical protein n=1 Tax=Ottowia sp. SB7-C50 TaxID=3081231 RepID=UPI00295345BC|nr:hypothetical protein [Ottowia sp. SB7-C50]WOP15095.1 hypothetical protein R0D99_14940 [Ottowia sp. SB7-C50]
MTSVTAIHRVHRLGLAAALALVGLCATPAWAQRDGAPSRTTQVQFKAGATDASYRGTLRGLQAHSYRFSARKGQVLNATLNSPSPDLQTVLYAIGKNGVAVNPVDDPLSTDHQTLPYSGRYEIRVMKTRDGGSAPYTLHLSIAHASDAPAAPTVAATPELRRAPWIHYRCQDGQRVSVRYHYGEATARAQVRVDDRITTLGYGADSNADMTVFEGGRLKWIIENLPPARKRDARGGMLTRAETQVVNGEKLAVDNILRKDCNPLR